MNPDTPSKQRNRRLSLGNVAVLLISTSFLGQLLGFLRTKLVNANFPATGPGSTDAYFAAFLIPDFFFFTLAAGALGVAFMPVLSDHLHRGDKKGMWELSASLLNLLAFIMAIVGIIIFVFADSLVSHIVAPHMTPAQVHTTATIMRFLAFNPLLFTISGILTSIQQTMGRFFFYAIAPLFYNTCIILSIYIFKGNIGLVGLGLGAFAGAVLQLLVIAIGMRQTHFRWHPKINFKHPDFRLVLRQLPARSIDQGIDQINSVVETNFARRIGEGNISFYNNAYTLHTAPVLLIGTTIATAAFPRLNQRLSGGRPDLFRRDFLQILRVLIWIILPVAVVSYFGRGYLARIIFSKNAPTIALVFGYLTLAIVFRAIYALISRWFYAQKDTKTPLFVSIFTIALNITLAYSLSRLYDVAGLAMAQSIVAMVEVLILTAIMLIRDHRLFDPTFWGGLTRIASVTGFSVVAGFIMVSLYPLGRFDSGSTVIGKLLLITIVTFVTHLLMSALFGLDEVRPLFKRLRQLVAKPLRIDY